MILSPEQIRQVVRAMENQDKPPRTYGSKIHQAVQHVLRHEKIRYGEKR